MKERKKDIKKKGRKPGYKLGIKKHAKILKFKIRQVQEIKAFKINHQIMHPQNLP
jgi:hypothetical protein